MVFKGIKAVKYNVAETFFAQLIPYMLDRVKLRCRLRQGNKSHISQAPNDKQEITPALAALNTLPEKLGKVDTMLADAGYFSKDNVASCEKSEIDSFIPPNREKHNQPLTARFSDPKPLPEDADPIDRMRHKLKTVEGRKIYAQRKSTINRSLALSNRSWDSDNSFCEVWRLSPANGYLCPLPGI
jgi:hypothetical protein